MPDVYDDLIDSLGSPAKKARPPLDYRALYQDVGKKYGVDPDLLYNQAKQESVNFNPHYVYGPGKSPKGAAGLSQFMPDTAKQYGLYVGKGRDDRFNPRLAADAQARMMKDLIAKHGDATLALAAYNSGHNKTSAQARRSAQRIPETRGYVQKIAPKGDKYDQLLDGIGDTRAPQSAASQSDPYDALLDSLDAPTVKAPVGKKPSPFARVKAGVGGQAEPTSSIPNVNQILTEAREQVAPPRTFAEDRAQRAAMQRQEQQARKQLREQIKAAGVSADQYKNFLLINRAADSPRMKEQFLDLAVKQATEKRPATKVLALREAEAANRQAETGRQGRVAQMGVGERALQIPKSAVGGFTGAVGTSLKGIATLAKRIDPYISNEYEGKETTDLATYQLGEAIQQLGRDNPIFKSDPDLEQEFIVGKAPNTIGQVAQFMLGGWATKSPRLAVAVMGAGMTAGDAYDEVRSLGGSDEDAVFAGLLAGGLLGPTEVFGMRGAVKALSGTAKESTMKAALKTALREGRRDVIENTLQEMGQEFGQGIITKNPRTDAQIVEAGALGTIGGSATVPLTLATQARGRVPSVPERPETISAQLDARGYSLIPTGAPRPPIPRGYRAEKTAEGIVFYDPRRISRETIRNTPTTELLGHVEPKSEATTEAVVARTPEGTELQSSAVSPENVGKQTELMVEQYPGARVETGGPELAADVIAERTAPQRFQHLQFGEVEVLADQSGARPGKIRVAEVADPTKQHFVRKSDMQGRGNARMIPIKESASEPVEVPVEPANVRQQEGVRTAIQTPLPAVPRPLTPAENAPSPQLRKADTPLTQNVLDNRLVAEIQSLRDVSQTVAFGEKGLSGLDVPSQRAVMSSVLNVIHDPKVFDSVIKFVPVEVVDVLRRVKSPSDVLLHDKAVSLDLFTVDAKGAVSIRSDVADSLVSGLSHSSILPRNAAAIERNITARPEGLKPKPKTTSVEQGVKAIPETKLTSLAQPTELAAGNLPVSPMEAVSRGQQPLSPAARAEKPIWEMSRSELEAARVREQTTERDMLTQFLGEADAERLIKLNRDYLNDKPVSAERDRLWAKLTPEQSKQVDEWYRASERRPSADDYRDYQRNLEEIAGSSDSEQTMANMLARIIPQLGQESNPARMDDRGRRAYSQLKYAAEVSRQAGLDPQRLEQLTKRAAGDLYGENARFMLGSLFKAKAGQPEVSEQPIKEVINETTAPVSREPEIGGRLGAGQGAPARETAPAPSKSEAGFLNPKLAKEGVYEPATTPVLKQVENATLNAERQRPTLSQYTRKAKSYIQRALIAEFTPLRELEQKLYGNKSVPVVDMARKFEQVAGAPAKAEADIIDFRRNVIEPIRKHADDFNSYLFLKRVEDRLMKEPERKRVADWTVEKARKGLTELETKVGADTYKELAKAGKVYQKEMDKALRLQVESGRMSEGLYNTIKEANDFYAPFKVLRYIEDADIVRGSGRRIATTQELAKKIKGIDSEDFQLGNILQASAEQIVRSRILAEKNLKMLELDKLADLDPKGELIQRVTDKPRPDQGKEFVRFLKDGKEQILEVDTVVADAVQGLNPKQAGLITKVMMFTRKPLQIGATSANASFQAVNLFFADLPRQALVSRYGLRNVKDVYQFPMDWGYSIFSSIKGNFGRPNQLYMDWLRSGAANSTIQRELTPESFRPTLGIAKPGVKNLGRSVLDSVAKFSNAIEETSKILGLKRGMAIEGVAKMSVTERKAAMEKIAAEVRNYSGSPDFARKGSETRDLNLLFMFFNARLQGVASDVTRLGGRTGTKEATAAWVRLGTGVALPATLLAIVNSLPENKEDYEKIPEWEKSNYFMIPRSSYFKNEDTGEEIRDYWRIPKRGVVQLIGNTAESAFQFGLQRKPKAAQTWAVDMVENLSPLNVEGRNMGERVESIFGSTNPALKLPAEILMNRDTFRHRNIVPEYMRKAAPAEQYRESTPRGYRMAGKILGVSPLQLEHAVEGATGSAASQFSIRPQQEGRSVLGRFPLTRRFVRSGSTATDDDVTQEQTDLATKQLLRRRERQTAIKKYRAGEISKADLDRMESEGLLTESDTKRVEKEGTMSSRQARFAAAAPNVALDRYERMDERQRNEVLSLMEKKAYALLNSEALTDAQKEEFRVRIEALGITPRNPRSQSSSGFKGAFGKRFRSQFATQ